MDNFYNLEPTVELLEFYKKRIAEFEKERQLYIDQLELLKTSKEEEHRLRWELRKREDEIGELKQALSDTNLYIHDERKQLLRLYYEVDELREQETKDREKIHTLLDLAQPQEQEISYFRGRNSNKLTIPRERIPKTAPTQSQPRFGPKNSIKKPLTMKPRTAIATRAPSASIEITESTVTQPISKHNRVLRAVYLPHSAESESEANAQIAALKALIEEERKAHDAQLQAVLDSRRLQQEEEHARVAALQSQVDSQIEYIAELEDKLEHAVRDFLVLRQQSQQAEAAFVEESTQLRARNSALVAKANHSRKAADEQIDHAEEAIQKRAQEMVDEFRKQLQTAEEENAALKEEVRSTKTSTSASEAKMRTNLDHLRKRHQETANRRGAELEALRRKNSALEGRLREMEKNYVKLARENQQLQGPGGQEFEAYQEAIGNAARGNDVTRRLRTVKNKLSSVQRELYEIPFDGAPPLSRQHPLFEYPPFA